MEFCTYKTHHNHLLGFKFLNHVVEVFLVHSIGDPSVSSAMSVHNISCRVDFASTIICLLHFLQSHYYAQLHTLDLQLLFLSKHYKFLSLKANHYHLLSAFTVELALNAARTVKLSLQDSNGEK